MNINPTILDDINHCGQTGLVWEQTGYGWRLFTIGGAQHQCPKGARC